MGASKSWIQSKGVRPVEKNAGKRPIKPSRKKTHTYVKKFRKEAEKETLRNCEVAKPVKPIPRKAKKGDEKRLPR